MVLSKLDHYINKDTPTCRKVVGMSVSGARVISARYKGLIDSMMREVEPLQMITAAQSFANAETTIQFLIFFFFGGWENGELH